MTGLVTVIFLGLFLLSFIQMDSININNYIDGLMNHNNMFTAIMGKIFFTVPVFLKALETNNIAYSLLFILLNAVLEASCICVAYIWFHLSEKQRRKKMWFLMQLMRKKVFAKHIF
jgi:ABC-2 type transport system permease protein